MQKQKTSGHQQDEAAPAPVWEGEGVPAEFRELNLSQGTLGALAACGFVSPTPIQALSLPVTLAGRDLIGQAHTGTGKTLAFAIPIVERIDANNYVPQAVILTPTRELAVQVSEEINRVAVGHGIRVVPVYGGEDIKKQLRKLERGAQVLVGTPGRFIDHLKRGSFSLNAVKIAVLDEADEMLDMGFYDDMVYILQRLPQERQTLFFSATMPPPIERLARRFLSDPEKVALNLGTLTVKNTRQAFYEVRESERLDVLCRILDSEGEWSSRRKNRGRVIIFCRTKWQTDELALRLQGRGYAAAGLHGDLSQGQRQQVLNGFRSGEIEVLVATDVAARGLDISGVTHVVNYHIPPTHEDYVHRVGRTGRAGREGMAITFVTPKEYYDLIRIQEGANVEIEPRNVPSEKEIEKARRTQLVDRIRHAAEADSNLKEEEARRIIESLGPEKALAGLITLLRESERELALRSRLQGGPGQGTTRLFMTIGSKDGMDPDSLAQIIAVTAGIEKKHIIRIDLQEKYTYLEVPSPLAGEISQALQEVPISGRKVKVEEARKETGSRKPRGASQGRKGGGTSRGGTSRGGGGKGRSGGRR